MLPTDVINNKYSSNHHLEPNSRSSLNGFINESNKVKVREYINPAVYVETTYNMNECKQTIYIPGSGDHPKTVKRCVCFTNPKECPCHPHIDAIEDAEVSQTQAHQANKENVSTLSTFKAFTTESEECEEQRCSSVQLTNACAFESDSGITVKATNSTSDLRLSIPSMSSISTVRFGDARDYNFRQWCQRKDAERKLHEEREMLIQKIKEQQKQAVVELERENFKKWLMEKKKKDDEEKKRKKLKAEELDRIKLDEKEKRMQQNQLNFQLWLKRKEEKDLEKKIKLQMTLIEREEQKQRREEYSQKAYDIWKQHAKNRQKPVPFGLGIDTLKSSSSVAYINPQPWVPNIDVNVKEKPHSQ